MPPGVRAPHQEDAEGGVPWVWAWVAVHGRGAGVQGQTEDLQGGGQRRLYVLRSAWSLRRTLLRGAVGVGVGWGEDLQGGLRGNP